MRQDMTGRVLLGRCLASCRLGYPSRLSGLLMKPNEWQHTGIKPSDLANLTDSSMVLVDGNRVKNLRDKKSWPQEMLASEAVVPVRTVGRIENSHDESGSVPYRGTFRIARALAAALECPVEELIWTQASGRGQDRDDRFTRARQLAAAATGYRQTVADVTHAIRADNNLLLTFLASYWQRQLTDVVIIGARVEVVIKEADYQECLRSLTTADRRGIRAFADLTNPAEREIWKATTDPETTWVSERTFGISWPMAHDDATMKWALALLQRQSSHRPKEYKVQVAIVDLPALQKHPIGKDASGWHLLVHEESQMAGGHRSNGDVLLIFEQKTCKAANNFYAKLTQAAVPFEPTFDRQRILIDLNQKTGGSAFKLSYTARTRDRPPEYFEDYEKNIRRWVPCYDDLTRLCARQLKKVVLGRINRLPTNRIFEIGVGTGNLTELVRPWIHKLNESATEAHLAPYIERYFGIDEASEMIERIPKQIKDDKLFEINLGDFPDNYKHLTHEQRIHIGWGNLVLHDILGPSSSRKRTLPEFLHAARELVTDDGVLIFGDAFFSPELGVEEQKASWKKGMMSRRGMSADEADDFIARNSEMVDTVTSEELAREAGQHGFGYEFVRLPPVTDHTKEPLQLPFGLLILSRIADSERGIYERTI
jgi:DNA-binding XRE family transcriptional regulator